MSIALTSNQVVVLRNLAIKPHKWSELRRAYFGEERAKQSASTSFYMQLKNLMNTTPKRGPLVQKTALGYEITTLGTEALQGMIDAGFDVDSCKTLAQTQFEATGIVAAKVAKAAVTASSEVEA